MKGGKMCKRAINLCLVMLWFVVSLSSPAPAQGTATDELPTAKDLSFMIGTWESSMVIKPNEMTPEGVTGKGTVEYRLFGQAIEGSRSGDSNRGHHEQRELIVYQKDGNSYLVFTVNQNGSFSERTMARNGDTWEVKYTGKIKNKAFTVRGRYKIISPDEFLYSSEIKVGNAGFKPFSQITYKRVSKN
jgi:hypothetical protein